MPSPRPPGGLTGNEAPNPADAIPHRGWLIAIAAMLILPGLDAIAKGLSDELPAVEIAFGRFAMHSILLTVVVLVIEGPSGFRIRRPVLLLAPGCAMALATLFFFIGLKFLPLADAISIFFVEPMVLTILAALLLGERVGLHRIGAILVGFVGALLVIRPNFMEVGWPALMPLGTALCFSFYIIAARRLVPFTSPITIQVYTGYSATLTLGLFILAGSAAGIEAAMPILPNADQLLRLAALGAVAALGHTLIATALRYIPVMLIAPLQYLEIISATLLGWIFYGDFPVLIAWGGIAIIIASGLYVYQREAHHQRHSTEPPRSAKGR